MRRRRRLWLALLTGLLSFAVLVIYVAWPGGSTFTVSPETTYVTGPLDQYGNVDYVVALNERIRVNITPETNANVLIWQALGPRPEGGNGMPAEYFQWLGIDPPPDQGDYFVGYINYHKEGLSDPYSVKYEELNEQQSRAARWPWRAADEPELADWLKRNEKPLALVIEASRRPDYYNPLVPKRAPGWCGALIDSLLPNVQKCREVANALACRAILRATNGEIDAAWQDLLACHRLGRLMARGQGSLIELLVGIAIEQVASKADIVFLESKSISSAQIQSCLRDLRSLPPLRGLGDKLDLPERFSCLNSMMLIASQGGDLSGTFSTPPKKSWSGRLFTQSINWDLALKNANQVFDRCAAAARAPDRPERAKKHAEIAGDVTSDIQRAKDKDVIQKAVMGPKKRGETIGNILIGLLLPAFEKVQTAIDRCEQTQRNLHLAFALAAYRRHHGKYPATLDVLAPKYLESIPDDVFSGQPLIYRPHGDGYLLYSVGPDGNDDDGQAVDDEPRGDDIAVRVPVPEPRVRN